MKAIVKKAAADLKGIGDKLESKIEIGVMNPLELHEFIKDKLGTDDYYTGFMPDLHKLEFLPNDWRINRSVTIEL